MLHILLTLVLGLTCVGCFVMAWIVSSVEPLDNPARAQVRHLVVLRQARARRRLWLVLGFICLAALLAWNRI
ncbi:hypothetical protein [Enterobacter sp. PTB]|uniref:hypothetical protein n=1 Tax=Enterobacter TaxID=547 RepID=UPI003DA93585